MLTKTEYAFSTEELVYLRHGDRDLKLRIYLPEGNETFPCVIDLHGGAWCVGTLEECKERDEALARAGITTIGLDFRDGKDGYPTSNIDINYAVRWAKSHAAKLKTRADLIGLCGQSSGGHLGMLAGMRPDDPRYASVKLPAGSPNVDATVGAVCMVWPVINPISRYRMALHLRATENPGWIKDIPERHVTYWKNDDAMIEGNPMLAMERGEKMEMPPAMWIQGRPDPTHDYRDPTAPIPGNEPERFTANYRRLGGKLDLQYIEQATRASAPTWAMVAAFFHAHLKP